ncbi:LysR family transcriptional regulator [Streptomyces sp. NBC_00280]
MAQSALSQQLKQMERQQGTQLFTRATAGRVPGTAR